MLNFLPRGKNAILACAYLFCSLTYPTISQAQTKRSGPSIYYVAVGTFSVIAQYLARSWQNNLYADAREAIQELEFTHLAHVGPNPITDITHRVRRNRLVRIDYQGHEINAGTQFLNYQIQVNNSPASRTTIATVLIPYSILESINRAPVGSLQSRLAQNEYTRTVRRALWTSLYSTHIGTPQTQRLDGHLSNLP
ncbi:hypothetical protein NIES22_02450 [Calothrix brevissima NIES-22]|nr:hypothetical protein NIES22_02450 [Calothrix brevissima NIES-22]